MQQDKKLIHRLKNGDQDALRILYLHYKDFLLTLANALLHDRSLAEDVVHDVFLKFTRNIKTFRLTGKFRAYLAACAVNEARMHLRKVKVRTKAVNAATEMQAKNSPCPIESSELSEQLRLLLASLPIEQREVLVLRTKAGLKFKDIADIQQTSVSTVQGRYRYGMDKLRSLLNGELMK